MTSLTRFKAFNTAPADTSGLATYSVGDLSCNVPLASFVHAQQLEAFIDNVAKRSHEDGKHAAQRFLRGAINTLEGDA